MAEEPDNFVPTTCTKAAASLQPTASWQYQTLYRKSADIATALAANRLAGILAGHLKARGMIGQPVFEQATNYALGVTEYARVEHLITAVLTKTKYNTQCYHDFIEVLELDGINPDTEAARSLLPKAAVPPTATTTSSSGRVAAKSLKAPTGIHTDSPGPQGSREAEAVSARELSMSSSETVSLFPKSTSEVLAPQDQNDTSSSFPHLNFGILGSQERLALQSKLLRDSDNIMLEFCDLKHHTINSIVSRCISVKKLHTRLSGLGTYRPTRKPVPLLRNQLDEIERAEDVEGVFSILDKYYSFFNYVIIEKLIGWFGTPEDKERLQTYTKNFKTFCKRRTFECPPDIFGQVDKGKTNLVVKVEESWDPTEGCPLENVLRLRNSLADILKVESETLYLCQIDKGCIELLIQIPSFVEEDIFPLSMEQERSLASVGVTRLTCGGYSFSQPPEALAYQAGVQTGAIGTLHPAELQSQHAELQQRMTGDSELLLQEIQEMKEQLRTLQADKQEFEQLLQIRSIENQKQQKELTTLRVEVQEIGEQVKALQLEKSNLEEKLAKETFLETALGYEVDALREDVMDRQQVQFRDTSTQTVVDIPETSLTGSLRGAEVVAERNFVITNQARSYHWDEFGFRLHVPENSLVAGLSETTVNVRVSLSGHFQLPADSELVSAVYWVFSPHMFSQPLTVDVQHCAAPSQSSNLSFVRTKCTQKELPYQFKELQGGSFCQQSFYGSISVNHFSGFGIKRRKSKSVKDDYCAQLYKSKEGLYDCRFIFAVTRNLDACFSVVDRMYCTGQAERYTSFTFGFKEEQISLDIPSDGIKDNGWEIFALSQPMVTKDAADMFKSGKGRIPQCDLMLQWTEDEKPTVPLKHKIDIHGATKDYFTLYNKIMATEPEVPRPISSRLPSVAESVTSQKESSGSESDPPYSPRTKQSGENPLPTFSISSPLPPLPTHKHLMNEVAMSIPTKWKFLGSELGLQPHQLDAIESDQNGIVALCFSAVFQKWENETTLPYSWSTVITVLEAPQVGAVRLAQTLKDRLALVRSI